MYHGPVSSNQIFGGPSGVRLTESVEGDRENSSDKREERSDKPGQGNENAV